MIPPGLAAEGTPRKKATVAGPAKTPRPRAPKAAPDAAAPDAAADDAVVHGAAAPDLAAPGAAPPKAAAPKTPRARKTPKPPPSPLDKLQSVIVGSLEDDKAEHIVTLDLSGRGAFCDRMVIATGLADRQISAMATHLEDKLAEAGQKRIQIEGAGGSDWVLIDAGDIVVHLFKPEARAAYALEKMWGPDLDESDPRPGGP